MSPNSITNIFLVIINTQHDFQLTNKTDSEWKEGAQQTQKKDLPAGFDINAKGLKEAAVAVHRQYACARMEASRHCLPLSSRSAAQHASSLIFPPRSPSFLCHLTYAGAASEKTEITVVWRRL